MIYRTVLALALAIALPTIASAGPLNADQVPEDTKWLAHVDLAALEETKALKEVRGTWPDRAQKFRNWMQETYGIDTREDFEGVTLYGSGYGEGDCVMLLTADFNADKVRSRINKQKDVQETAWRGHTIYTCQASKNKEEPHDSRGDEWSSKKDKKSHTVAWVLVDDNTIAYAKSKRSVKDAVETIEGHSASLKGEDSELTSGVPENAVVYASAIELKSIPHEGAMFPLLRQHKRACFAAGERDGKLFDELKLVARNEEVASQMKQVVEGFSAMLKVSLMDSEPLRKMVEDVEVQQDGATVTASWNGEIQRFAQALQNYKSSQQRR
ncbi:hypothetical protein Mal64_07600 [Pseudobythopirellula maris]|uniref:Uncharacterized protein n=1 Tax=Pseudobythopirellula maris TaxID=2527991 RepID=A0A5C5ZU24_9BACT|nr:hypothetical protein [Pseudobythopirellula maris]TWT90371.1 hypothetical protein Mal64_07600 [Pseudobythopirellula maris]